MLKTIENKDIMITVNSHGAELQRLVLKRNNKNYLWHGDPKHWGRTAPVLFPIVGRLKDNKYFYDGNEYKMTQHGFARDMEFTLSETGEDYLIYYLKSNQKTKEIYPFDFKLEIKYQLINDKLKVSYKVINKDQKRIYFSIGAHPAFYWPLKSAENKKDYYLEFAQEETKDKFLLSAGLLNNEKESFLEKEKKIELYPEIFKDDALIFEDLKSNKISLKSKKSNRKVEFEFTNFPYLGIWSQSAESPFICLEPWYGIADSIDSSGKLKDKKGIIELNINSDFESTYSIKVN